MHTPTPWKVVSGMIETEAGVPIAHMHREPGNGTLPVERDENADFIVRACNAYEALLTVCERVYEYEYSISKDRKDRDGTNVVIALEAVIEEGKRK